MDLPLDGIRVLDLSRVLAGPWAGQMLGDYGADVVKVERPEVGDDTRHWGPPWLEPGHESAYFLAANRNKRSITVDLSSEDGRDLVRDLVKEADVLIENFRVGTMDRYGLSHQQLLNENPRLVLCSISAFGQTGAKANEPGYDAMIQASAGLMSITGPRAEDGGGPQKVGVAISDIMAGMYATTAILAALNARSETGRGQHVDVPLYDSQVAWLANQAMNYLVGQAVPGRMGTAHPNLVPYQAFSTRDGNFMLAVGNDRQFAACCDAIGLPELSADTRFASAAGRVTNRDALIPVLEARFREADAGHWIEALKAAGVPCGPICSVAEVLDGQQVAERNLVRRRQNGAGADAPTVANPVEFGGSEFEYRLAPPLLGEHTGEVLREWLGYSDADISRLRESKAI